jgi:SAM-dependent methyltransferase
MNDLGQTPLVSSRSLLAATLAMTWSSDAANHREVLHVPKLNVWRDLDLLPRPLQGEIVGRAVGHVGKVSFPAGALVEPWTARNVVRIKDQQFNRHWLANRSMDPRLGRFYPRGVLQGVTGVFPEDHHPARLIDSLDGTLSFDLNHPVARHAAEVQVEIGGILPGNNGGSGRCTDLLADLAKGPGMQIRYGDLATNFFTDAPFDCEAPGDDAVFYAQPRMLNHLDSRALDLVRALYGQLLDPGAEILDLMSSFNSHIPEQAAPARVTGLGMNQAELDANRQLHQRLVHDLNLMPQLPFPDSSFDAVLCTVSVEYLTNPFAVFREVARVLRPAGIFALTFSNRWFPPKVIRLWQDLHEFERLGLVLEYFLACGDFERLETLSVRGFERPEDDPHIQQTIHSDPVYAVWGYRQRAVAG